MQEAIPAARTELSDFAPRMYQMKINPERIRDVIGKGGATIRAITEETGTTIDIQDDGSITIAAVDAEAARRAQQRIADLTAEVEIGKIYNGTVLKIEVDGEDEDAALKALVDLIASGFGEELGAGA